MTGSSTQRIPSALAIALIATIGGQLQHPEVEVTDDEPHESERRP